MKGPITLRVRWSWSADTLIWAENATDANGLQDLRTERFWTSDVPGLGSTKCQHWDDDNWSCVANDEKGKLLYGEAMKDGKLKWYYWGEMREMTTRHRILNKPMPF